MNLNWEHPPKTKVSVAEFDGVTKNIETVTRRRRRRRKGKNEAILVGKAMEGEE